jgi:alpha,alpha-trehalase
MKREHAFWMAGREGLKPGTAHLHVVAMPDGSTLNRYFDLNRTPRDEAFGLDVSLAAKSGRTPSDFYVDVRAAAESGWDFSSRWLGDGRTLETLQTTHLVEPDLNSLLYGLERAIEAECGRAGDHACAQSFRRQADQRARAVRRWLWDDTAGLFRDYDWRRGRMTSNVTAATLYPLFTGLATAGEARRIASIVRTQLLAPGGLRTTTVTTGQQWDAPNGWAPLQWIGAEGLARYGESDLADQIRCRWLKTVQVNYALSGKLVEKYDVEATKPGGGGEYALQDGFGWTNGVAAAMRCTADLSLAPGVLKQIRRNR